jgi:hypothetical protein
VGRGVRAVRGVRHRALRQPALALKRARGDLGKLLDLAEVETAFLIPDLPAAIAVLCREDEARGARRRTGACACSRRRGRSSRRSSRSETLGELRACTSSRGHGIPLRRELLRLRRRRAALLADGRCDRSARPGPRSKRERSTRRRAQPAGAAVRSRDTRGLRGGDLELDWFMEEVGPGSTPNGSASSARKS